MDKKVPDISEADLKRIIKRDFSKFDSAEIASLLNAYKSESRRGWNRVCASILKLSDGKIDSLKKYVEKANNDYRDIIALSEYPNYSEFPFEDVLSDQSKKRLIEEDWTQYQAWLNKA